MKSELEKYIKGLTGEDLELNYPERENFGHLSSSSAFKLATKEDTPLSFANRLKLKIDQKDKGKFFERVESIPPGFVNFWLKDAVLIGELKKLLKEKDKYGKPTLRQAQGKKIQVEFISANPTGPLTMANGRGGFLGDALSNILEWAGYDVEREYYVNDTGNQILTLGKSLLAAAGIIPDEEKFYKANYIASWAKKHKAIVKDGAESPLKLGQIAAKDFLSAIKNTVVKKAKIRFDRFTSEERDIHKRGYVAKALEIFKRASATYEKDGALWLKTTERGDDKDRVLMTRDGFLTYFLADAGHYLETKERKFERKINIIGPDHYGYVARIQAAAKLLGLKDSQIIVTQAVRVIQNGVEVKMSKRKGTFITFEEVVEEVGADAARFFFLMHTPTTHMDFDLELAKERSMKNPVYYAQYAYVRTLGILSKTKSLEKNTSKVNFHLLHTEVDQKLIIELLKFPDIVKSVADDYEVSRLTRYLSGLARLFHNFYEKERIAGEKEEIALARRELVKATQVVLKMTLDLLGISTPKKM
jgi:arginyl-tRNA synthetase